MAYDNTDKGALFKNANKATDNHPDYRGSINVGGTEYWLSAWINKSNAGATYMSLAVQPKNKDAAHPDDGKSYRNAREGGRGIDEMDSDIPFNQISSKLPL
ncbi:hypothetical protein [Ralstonia pseudosolanacearum]|uniref:hypothetical protein n=1 Tax=Ralstonia pseudosolanacearum TaxID=1310165 RepID=UPI0011C3716B